MRELNLNEQKNVTGGFTTTMYCYAGSDCLKEFSNRIWSNGKGSFTWWSPTTYVKKWYEYYYDGAMPCYEYDAEHI